MTEFYTEGKARAIGVSNYCPSCYQCLEAMDNLTMPMVNQARNRKKPIDKG
jgi:diketogulonate reductase-like aldo/keto reductase